MEKRELWRECPIQCEEDHSDDGIVQRYIHLTRKFEAPTSFHVFSLLTIVAAATARRVVIDRGGYRLWPNLYTLLHGPSGLGKGIATGHAIDIVTRAVEVETYPEDISGEGLFRLMHEQTEEGRPALGLLISDEFGELIGGQEYKRDVVKRLTRLYSCPQKFDVGRAGSGRREAERIFLSILGNSQEDWLRSLPPDAIKGGFFARVIAVPEERRRFRRFYPGVDEADAAAIVASLKERLEGIEPGLVTMTKPAFARSVEWYEGGEDDRWRELDPIVYPWCERRMDHALKLGYLMTLLEGEGGDPLIIDDDGILWGLDAVEWLTPRIEQAFLSMHETKTGELHRRIMGLVQGKGDMSERRVQAAMGRQWGKRQIDDGLFHLVAAGKVTRYQGVDGRGRPDWRVRVNDRRDQEDGQAAAGGESGEDSGRGGGGDPQQRDVSLADAGDDADPGGAGAAPGEGAGR